MTPSISIVAAINNEALFAANLARSPAIADGTLPLKTYRNAASMAEIYNRGIDETDSELVAFTHQDVYLPRSWVAHVVESVRALERLDRRWAVAGPYGLDASGRHVGHVYCCGVKHELDAHVTLPAPAASFDELLLIVRRASGLRFDDGLPSFHLYGTDIARSAAAAGRGAWVIDAPVIHNTRMVVTLAGGYTDAYRYMQHKWAADLPIPTTICTITHAGMPLWRERWRAWKRRVREPAPLPPRPDPVRIAEALGYE